MRSHTPRRRTRQQRASTDGYSQRQLPNFPGHSWDEIRQELVKIVADPKVNVGYVQIDNSIAPAAPNEQQLPPVALLEVVAELWPGVPVFPDMSIGASDRRCTYAAGMPSFGIQGVALDNNDIRAHGKDERLPIESFNTGALFFYRYLKALTSAKRGHIIRTLR